MVMATPSPQQVGREFVRQYYTVLHEAPDMLHRFYSSGSTFVHGGIDHPSVGHIEEPVVGQLEIDKKIRALNFKDCHTKIRQVDSQSTIGNGVVVQVTGELSNNGEPMRRFMQTFVLAPQTPKKYYVHNCIFRYQDEVYQDISDAESEEVQTTTALPTPPQSQPQAQPQAPTPAQPTVTEIKSTTITDSYFQSSSSDSGLVITQQHQQENQHVVLTSPAEATHQAPVSPSPAEVELTAHHNHVHQPEPVESKPAAHAEHITEKPKSTESSSSAEQRPNSWAKIITNKEGGQAASGTAAVAPAAVQAAQQLQPPAQPQSQRNKENKPPKTNGAATQSGAPKPQRTPNHSASSNQVQSVPVENTNGTLTSSAPLENGAGLSNGSTIEDLEKRFGRYSDGQQIFVGNLSPDLSDAELKAFFGQYGRVVEIRINTNQKQQSGRRLPNYGFVVFEDKHAVDQLLGSSKSNNLTYKNEKGEYRLNVEEKRARQGRQSTTGGGGGYSGKGGNRAANRSNSNGSRGASANKNESGVSAAKKPYQTNELSNYAGEGRRAGGANRRS